MHRKMQHKMKMIYFRSVNFFFCILQKGGGAARVYVHMIISLNLHDFHPVLFTIKIIYLNP